MELEHISKQAMESYLTSDEEAIEILVDMVNGDYTVEALKNDFLAHFEPDDRGDMER